MSINQRTGLLDKLRANNYLFPFILVSCLFFMWGFAHSFLDVLNKHFQDSLTLSKAQSGAIQAVAYGAYFIMALPAGMIARRYGYKTGIIFGLCLFALGSFWFVPAVSINAFWAFLLGLLMLFSGLTFLETVANPYIIVLGDPQTSASRLNLAQTFNALGWILGPLVGSILVLDNGTSASSIWGNLSDAVAKIFLGLTDSCQEVVELAHTSSDNSVLLLPYIGLGLFVVLILLLFIFTKLPEMNEEKDLQIASSPNYIDKPLFRQSYFILAVIAQFLYVAAQTGVGSFFINYAIEVEGIFLTKMQAGLLLALGGMTLFALGRFAGSMLMQNMQPRVLLAFCGLANSLLMLFVVFFHNRFGVMALMLSYLFMSVMFPSIFALALKNLGKRTKLASSILVLTIVGGAVAPMLMGWMGEERMNIGFLVPLVAFFYIFLFGLLGHRVEEKQKRA